MLRRLGEYILAGRFQAVLLTSLLSMLGLIVPLFSYLASGAVPALVTLRKSINTGLQVIAGSVLVTLVFVLVAGASPYIVLALAVGIWLPIWACAGVLKLTESQGNLLVTAAVFGLVYILLTHMLLGDVTEWWRSWLQLWVEQMADPSRRENLDELVGAAAPLMNAMTAGGLFVSLVSTILVARWWQAHLFNKGGFRQEFHALQLPRTLVFVVAADMVYMLASGAQKGSVAMDIMLLLMFVYLFQGIAGMHRLVASKNLSRGWLTGMYLFMFLLPQTILVIACVGMVDSWLVRKTPGSTNDNS